MTRLWRWLTCGHGWHRWQIHTGVELGTPTFGAPTIVVARGCPRCRVVEVLE